MHITGEILGNTVNADTLYFSWACMALILLVAMFLGMGLSSDTAKYGVKQHLAESIYGFVRSLCLGQIGKRGDNYVYFIGSIFIFILVSYYAGLLPWKMGSMFEWWPQIPLHELTYDLEEAAELTAEHAAAASHGAHQAVAHGHPWHGASPCADINVPAAMAICVIVVYFFTGAAVGGFKYVQMFLPINFGKKGISLNLMCLIEVMDLIVRPLTLTLRLFANTVAGETLLATFIALVALVLPVAILGFEMAVGLLQAFIFTILSTVYIGGAVQHAEHLLHNDHH